MSLRLFVGGPLVAGAECELPPDAARHAQVRRAQPGDRLVLFDGAGHEAEAEVLAMGRREVRVRLGAISAPGRELPLAVTLAVVMPANERMDALVEKATELGVAALQPLMSERSVLRLEGERAARKQAHWQAVAVAACEQCGRNVVPVVRPVQSVVAWLRGLPSAEGARWLLHTGDAPALATHAGTARLTALAVLSGPEGGFTPAEVDAARNAGFAPVSLGPRILRADTAPLALLAWLGLMRAG
jgi:16S rRNA (uracil1498-N3)-methyltransferase